MKFLASAGEGLVSFDLPNQTNQKPVEARLSLVLRVSLLDNRDTTLGYLMVDFIVVIRMTLKMRIITSINRSRFKLIVPKLIVANLPFNALSSLLIRTSV